MVQSRCPSDFARFAWVAEARAEAEGAGLRLLASPELVAELGGDWPWVVEALVAGVGAAAGVAGPWPGLSLRLEAVVVHPTDSRLESFRRLAAEASLATAQALAAPKPGVPLSLPCTVGAWRALAEAVEGARLPQEEWRHPQHLAVGAWWVREVGLEEARRRLPLGIQGLNEAHGVPQTPTRGYHETLTQAWLGLVAEAWQLAPADFGPILRLHATVRSCLDPSLPGRFHSREQLASWAARSTWVLPDLAPYPASWAALG